MPGEFAPIAGMFPTEEAEGDGGCGVTAGTW